MGEIIFHPSHSKLNFKYDNTCTKFLKSLQDYYSTSKYSFRDEEVNEIFKRNMKHGKSTIVLLGNNNTNACEGVLLSIDEKMGWYLIQGPDGDMYRISSYGILRTAFAPYKISLGT